MPQALAISTARSVGEVRETNTATCILTALFSISAERRPPNPPTLGGTTFTPRIGGLGGLRYARRISRVLGSAEEGDPLCSIDVHRHEDFPHHLLLPTCHTIGSIMAIDQLPASHGHHLSPAKLLALSKSAGVLMLKNERHWESNSFISCSST